MPNKHGLWSLLLLTEKTAKVSWSQEEDATLTAGRENGLTWEQISEQLSGRTVIACKRRFDNRQRQTGPWSEKEAALLQESFKRHMDSWKDFWKKVAQDVGNGRTWQMCEKKMDDLKKG
ncbi:hypothetical protein BC937DRAFT_86958 [Endogone sp. FLAS-F59071]|nr:hypothetical protein BC937DRAFT_86958 [Endogone sp. FLAS-F59071]|eukprot:RUS19764.1 hypothetical protein BC937DRAFT_86958 [Endogone sp. FLAS-F59071]